MEHPQREKNFYKWLDQVESDLHSIVQKRGLQYIVEAMKKPFGEQAITKTFSTLGEKNLNLRCRGALKWLQEQVFLVRFGSVTALSAHNFHGND